LWIPIRAVRPTPDPKPERAGFGDAGLPLTCSDSAPVVEELKQKIDAREIDAVDAAKVDDYIVSMRRHLRPLCFSASREQSRRVAERVILDSAQNGTLDFPLTFTHRSKRQSSRFFANAITPNQITIGGFVIGCSATAAFALGRVGLGIIAALMFWYRRWTDGKQSRVKIETTELGKWEHHLDDLIEYSWWTAIAFNLWRSGQFPTRVLFFALLIGSHVLDHSRDAGRRWLKAACWMTSRRSTVLSD